jgi:monodechloroaminopyrrolnitrin synthase
MGSQLSPSAKIQNFMNYITDLDPLSADAKLQKLPEINAGRDIKAIARIIEEIMPTLETIELQTEDESIATMRDLGILAGSLKRHGCEPIETIPQLEPILVSLAQRTDMVPRDTFLHYIVWNPKGVRQRRYTCQQDETHLIQSGSIAVPKLEAAIANLVKLHSLPIDAPEFVQVCNDCATNLMGMVEAIVYAIKNISRHCFATELRPYFDPILVQGQKYLGPGAVEMPLFIFDHLLWSADRIDQQYRQFQQNFLPYCLPKYRRLHADFQNKPSLMTKVCRYIATNNQGNSSVLEATNIILGFFKILIKFRKPHIKVVNEAYTHIEKHPRDIGSGGYQSSMLNYIADLTEKAMSQMRTSVIEYTSASKASMLASIR